MYRVYDKKETTWVKENIYLAPNNDLYLAKKNLLAHAVGALPSLAWLAILILIYAIELVVGAIQAYVFTVLTAVYVSEAEEVAEEE